MKNGNVLWRHSASSLQAAILGCPSLLERNLTRCDKFAIKLKIRQGYFKLVKLGLVVPQTNQTICS